MADDLYQRYMEAAAVYRHHASGCDSCSQSDRCFHGERLHKAFAKRQDDYSTRLSAKRR
ncbi:hypothetical protein ABZY44_17670 [Streptomyces sp. NPDC006544]|uniref:hypothetical protein n=1 Tax=Streptomyces sp. NPDC006544 TaxID=3154583 RepID=UPI0033A7BC5B